MVPMSEEPGASAPENSSANQNTAGLTRRQLREQGLMGQPSQAGQPAAPVAPSGAPTASPTVVPTTAPTGAPTGAPTEPVAEPLNVPRTSASTSFDDLMSFESAAPSKRELKRQAKAEAKAHKAALKHTKRSESGKVSQSRADESAPTDIAPFVTVPDESDVFAPLSASTPAVDDTQPDKNPQPARRAKPAKLAKAPKSVKPAKAPKNKDEPGPKRKGQVHNLAQSSRSKGAWVFSAIAMAFVAGIAVSTSVPATALLTPDDVALAAAQQHVGDGAITTDDSQTLDASGKKVVTSRDGVSVSAAPKNGKQYVGAYSVNKLKVDVPESNGPVLWPVDELDISSTFGSRNLLYQGEFHTGLDFAPGYGVAIHAIADGIVTEVDNPGSMCGVAVIIDHNINGEKFSSVYCHMQMNSSPLTAGQTVQAGDLVGLIGNTGWTTGPHLHLEIRVNEQPIDPYAFLLQHAGQPTNPGHAG